MTINISIGSGEITGVGEIKDVNLTFDFAIEETASVAKQILPAIRELKEFGIFQTQKDNDKLCEDLNKAREEKSDVEREFRQVKSAADLQSMKLKDELQEKSDKIRDLEAQLKEANLRAKLSK